MDLIDLFIGSEGTLGIVVEATLRVIPRPRRAVALIRCDDDGQAVAVTGALRATPACAQSSTCRRSSTWTPARCEPSPDETFARARRDDGPPATPCC